MKGEPEDEVRATIAGAGASTTCDLAAEPAVKVHQTKLAIVARIEGIDNLTPDLAAKLKVVPAARPTYRVFELPDVVVKVRSALLGPQVRER